MRLHLAKDRKQQGQINKLQEDLKKVQQEEEYLREHRSIYRKD